MTAMFKNVHNNKINDMIDKYNNAYKKQSR